MCPPLGWTQHMHMQWASDEGGRVGPVPTPGGAAQGAWVVPAWPTPPLAVLAPIGSSSWDSARKRDPPESSPGFEARTNCS